MAFWQCVTTLLDQVQQTQTIWHLTLCYNSDGSSSKDTQKIDSVFSAPLNMSLMTHKMCAWGAIWGYQRLFKLQDCGQFCWTQIPCLPEKSEQQSGVRIFCPRCLWIMTHVRSNLKISGTPPLTILWDCWKPDPSLAWKSLIYWLFGNWCQKLFLARLF